ncbi:MAG: hypothetical protein WC658_02735 [Candidatus Omnitrophota bacterium]
MIEINLLSAELKPKSSKFTFNLSQRNIAYLFAAGFGLLLSAHILLFASAIIKSAQLTSLNSKWNGLASQRITLDGLKKEYEGYSSGPRSVQQISDARMSWAKGLNALSLDLPSGVWFQELSINQKDFTLKASCVSLAKEELALINKFMETVKKDTDFFKYFDSLELGAVQRRSVGGYDIVDFILDGKLK